MRVMDFCLPVLAAGIAVPASASALDHAAIDHAIAQFTGASIGAEGGARAPVDRRLKLSDCRTPVEVEWYDSARTVVIVRCTGPGFWRIFVPVRRSAELPSGKAVVQRGDRVSVQVQGEGFVLSRGGEAMESGAVGDRVRVRLAGEQTGTLSARVVDAGKVGIELP